jgi:flagellar hook-associated protein 3 FlgL
MRISTSTIFESGVARITDLQTRLAKTQQQISTGREVLTPADDPVAASRALEVSQSLAINAQFADNRASAKAQLNEVESTLSSISDIIENSKALVVSAGNATFDDQQRGFVAVELRGAFDDLLARANAKDGTGNYLFSGYQTTTQPFVATAAGALYNGDQGTRVIQVGSSQQMGVSETGETVFRGDGKDIFKTLADLINLLESPVGTPADAVALKAGLSVANGEIDLALDKVLSVRAAVGSRLKQLDALDSAGDVLGEQYQKRLGDLQDVDYARAITALSQQQLTLEAAQQSFIRLTSLSLFNYLA